MAKSISVTAAETEDKNLVPEIRASKVLKL
jgi:hypothetical protein